MGSKNCLICAARKRRAAAEWAPNRDFVVSLFRCCCGWRNININNSSIGIVGDTIGRRWRRRVDVGRRARTLSLHMVRHVGTTYPAAAPIGVIQEAEALLEADPSRGPLADDVKVVVGVAVSPQDGAVESVLKFDATAEHVVAASDEPFSADALVHIEFVFWAAPAAAVGTVRRSPRAGVFEVDIFHFKGDVVVATFVRTLESPSKTGDSLVDLTSLRRPYPLTAVPLAELHTYLRFVINKFAERDLGAAAYGAEQRPSEALVLCVVFHLRGGHLRVAAR